MRPSMQECHKTGAHLPRQHHKQLKSTNMLERLNEEIRRRTHVVRIFPNGESAPIRREP
jgi:transposase-like protein